MLHNVYWLTGDDDGGSSFYVVTSAAVCAAVLGLAFPDQELQGGAALLHLVFLSVGQHVVSLPPLHRSAGFRELTAERHSIALLYLNILQLLKEFDWPLWSRPQEQYQNEMKTFSRGGVHSFFVINTKGHVTLAVETI